MGFFDMILSAYGINKPTGPLIQGTDGGDRTLCATNDPECLAGLQRAMKETVGTTSLDSDDRLDEQRWVNLHQEVIRRSQTDKTLSRWNMLVTLYKSLPKWIKIMLLIVFFILCLIGVIPGLMILVEVMSNAMAMFKVIVLMLFGFSLILGYRFIPL